jgi:hypothetical protein
MNEESIDVFLENQSLKSEFASRALELACHHRFNS